jgi:uncharacterized protein (TIRG00374 family)
MNRGVADTVEYLKRASRSLLVRLGVTAGLLTAIALQVDWSTAKDRISGGHWSWFALAVGLLLLSQVVGALRWYLLLKGAGLEPGPLHALRAFMIGVFSNNFLPTSFGGDVARALIIARSGPRLVKALTSVAVDRLTSIWCLLAVSWVAIPTESGVVPRSLVLALLAMTLGGSAIMLGVFALAMRGGQRLARHLPERVVSWASQIRATLWLYARQVKTLAWASLLGVAYQALAVTAVWAIAKAINLHLPYALAAVTAPLVLAITLIPISLAGFGVREGGMVLVLGAANYSATDATLLSLIGVVALVLSTLPGAIAILLRGPDQQPRGTPSVQGQLPGADAR